MPSPNFGPRRHGRGPDMVVLHHTAMDSCAAAIDRLCDPGAEVSAHYLISETGAILRLVDETMRAWHAGAGRWAETDDVNSHSIGIELANPGPLTGFPPFAEPQFAATERLLADILARHDIPPQNVIAHSDMAPLRKFDPGAKFDWQRLARAGLSVWPTIEPMPQPPQMPDFLRHAERFGYRLPQVTDGADPADILLAAFRLRFFPGKTGALDAADLGAARDLAVRFPSRVGLDPVPPAT